MIIDEFLKLGGKEIEKYISSLSNSGLSIVKEEYTKQHISSKSISRIRESQNWARVLKLDGIYWGKKLVKSPLDLCYIDVRPCEYSIFQYDYLNISFYNSIYQVVFSIQIDVNRNRVSSITNHVV